MTKLPQPRGPLSTSLFDALGRASHDLAPPPVDVAGPLDDDDLHLALSCCYELSYRGFDGVDERWEWAPSLLAFRAALENEFEGGLRAALGDPAVPEEPVVRSLRRIAEDDEGPSLSRYLEAHATTGQVAEFLVHRSVYHLKEADPHSWGIPRLSGAPKAALVEIQHDEYGSGRPERMHATLFADLLVGVGLDPAYGAYLDVVPGVTLATVNLMSLFGLHRRWRGALCGHLALFEATSTVPNRRYGNALRRLGLASPSTVAFFDEHVEADAVHEHVALHDLAGRLATEDPTLAGDIVWGARALALLDRRWAAHVLGRWRDGRTSLRAALPAAAPSLGTEPDRAASRQHAGGVATQADPGVAAPA